MTRAARPELVTDRLCLRAPDARDLDAVTAFYQTERAALAGGTCSAPEAVTRFLALLGHWSLRGYGLFAVTLKGAPDSAVGLVGPYFPPGRPETEIGWVLFDGAEGKGYATEAARAAIGFARTALGWTQIVHYIDAQNAASIAVADRLGSRLDPAAPRPLRRTEGETLVYRHRAEGAA
ncbi:GNAT family N-acetyltransferase [Cognatishimia sp. F0-27]|uniref:GNAT family N-acetyltransferase n=1 Tax=Cognatishimia sp. F0-27 TaxID=2816855 RepID=UPI001D0C9F1A|nr:GNAT family N-acetyltransferase [Cognatishimia sp. F0-27]MCC1490977.1 GNAT family N-acetyltransferase [Cognatishimia sp. F0-27]